MCRVIYKPLFAWLKLLPYRALREEQPKQQLFLLGSNKRHHTEKKEGLPVGYRRPGLSEFEGIAEAF